jgi:hypothetical protein
MQVGGLLGGDGFLRSRLAVDFQWCGVVRAVGGRSRLAVGEQSRTTDNAEGRDGRDGQ